MATEIKDKKDSVGGMAKLLAKLYYYMAKEIVNSCGKEDGEKIIRRAICNYGIDRGLGIRKAVLEKGLELSFENMEHFSDIPENNSWEATSEATNDYIREVTKYCPYASMWEELGDNELGYLYCEQDYHLARAYKGEIEFERPSNIMDYKGSLCEMIIRAKK